MTHISARLHGIPLALGVVFVSGLGCTGGSQTKVDAGPDAGAPADEPTEWVNYHVQIPLDAGANFATLANGLFGPAAQAGQFLNQQQIATSVYVTSAADPVTPAQVRLTFAYDDGSGTPRTLATTPASYQVGQIFLTTVDAAIAKMQADVAANYVAGESFNLSYQVTSTQGGSLGLGLLGNAGAYSLSLDITSPHTSLLPGAVGMAASSAAPYDLVAGTVNFTQMTLDSFDYFANHAYGAGATAGQNFANFQLLPYDWLRLTVTPNLPENIVNVSFAVATGDGGLLQLAQAPASVMAGNTFQTLVDRQVSNQTKQEAAQPGSSPSWSIPFYYDQPNGGGVVQVLASGGQGAFNIAYSVASPQHPLVDVPFVPYKDITFPADAGSGSATPCYDLGLAGVFQAAQGTFDITFSASDAIVQGLQPGQQLVGDIACEVYYATDVTIAGPVADAGSLEHIAISAANLLSTPPPTISTTTPLQNGEYQILCIQFTDGIDDSVDKGDPVTLPIGGYTVACNVNPVAVQFAILNPSNND